MSILSKELQAELYAEGLARAEKRLKFARADYMKEYWRERVAYFKAAQQGLHLTGGSLPAQQALSKPEVSSASKQNPVPPTRK
ncbi:MAG TPA: hypothetical protein PLA27_17320 [Anaerolineales bacterium]|nr:hypothetical protein [Anaerolineales bacterium]